MPPRHLRIVDQDSGEVLDECPSCRELDRELRRQRKIIADLRADKEAEARASELWPQALTLWTEWKVATGRTKCKWSADRFWLCEPYLRADGFVVCRWAVWGVAYEPNRKVLPSGLAETYSDWELVFRNRGTFERYCRRGHMNPEARAQFDLREQGIEASA